MSLAAYAAEDDPVCHYWEERPLGLANFTVQGNARAKKWELTVIYWMVHRAHNGGARECIQGAEGVCNPIGGTTI